MLLWQASVSAEDNLGRQALHLAAQSGSEESVIFLVEKLNADVNVISSVSGVTPLHVAAKASEVTEDFLFLHISSLADEIP